MESCLPGPDGCHLRPFPWPWPGPVVAAAGPGVIIALWPLVWPVMNAVGPSPGAVPGRRFIPAEWPKKWPSRGVKYCSGRAVSTGFYIPCFAAYFQHDFRLDTPVCSGEMLYSFYNNLPQVGTNRLRRRPHWGQYLILNLAPVRARISPEKKRHTRNQVGLDGYRWDDRWRDGGYYKMGTSPGRRRRFVPLSHCNASF